MRAVTALTCLALTACAAPKPVVQPGITGGSRADGIVTMSAMTSIYQPVAPDLLAALDTAARRCRGWGYRGQTVLAGSREFCRRYARWGRCTHTQVTRHYDCTG